MIYFKEQKFNNAELCGALLSIKSTQPLKEKLQTAVKGGFNTGGEGYRTCQAGISFC